MKKRILLLSLLTLSLLTSQAQWVAQMHSDVSAKSIAMQTDNAENVFVAGVYSQTLTLLGTGFVLSPSDTSGSLGKKKLANTTLTGSTPSITGIAALHFPANNNVFLSKYSKDGVLLWAKSLGQVDTTAEPVRSYLALQVDGVGNSYLFGYWNANCTMTGFDCDTRKPGLIKFNPQGDTTWVKYASPASSIFEGYLEKSEKDEELYLNFSATTAFTFGGQAFTSGGKTFAIKADGTQRVVSELPGASPMLVYPCSNVLYKYGNNLIYRDSANAVGRTVLSITGSAKILKLEVDSLGYLTGIGKFKDASINVAGQILTNSRPALVNTNTPGWDVFAFKIKKSGEKVWVKNIMTWETGTGNGYIGMTVDSEGSIAITLTFKQGMSVSGQNYLLQDGTSDVINFRIRAQGLVTAVTGFVGSDEKNPTQIFNRLSLILTVFTNIGHTNAGNFSINQLSNLGNGIVIYYGGTPIGFIPPAPFSTKFLYCNTITSEPTIPGTNTGIAGLDEANELVQIYPNPTGGAFTINLAQPEVTTSYCIYNLLGIEIQKGNLTETYQIYIPKAGIYIVEITRKNEVFRQKIIVQ